MPDARLARTRASLPEGYQYPVARTQVAVDHKNGIPMRFISHWTTRHTFDPQLELASWYLAHRLAEEAKKHV